MEINDLLAKTNERGASGLVLKVNSPPLLSLLDELIPLGEERLGLEEVASMAQELTTEAEWSRFQEHLELDIAYALSGVGRFRVNLFKQRGSVSMVFRSIASEVPTLESLELPSVVAELAMRPRGLVLVTGPASSGKTTTQAAMMDHRNGHEECHIVTIEDPIEYIHTDKKALINQRQVGRDTNSFAAALKYVLRQDPDVILIGEMRDAETIGMALTAAETGHLAIGTLHTANSSQSIDRMINVFPNHQQQTVRMQLSTNLLGIISQVLLNRSDGKGQVACFEVLIGTSAVRNVIREGKTHQIPQLLEMGTGERMISMERSLANFIKQGTVTVDEALAKSTRPDELLTLLGPDASTKDAILF